MAGVRRVIPLTLGWIDLPRHVLVRDDSDEQVRVPVPGVLLLSDGGWLLLEHGAGQGAAVRHELVVAGLRYVRSHHDLAGNERITEGQYDPL